MRRIWALAVALAMALGMCTGGALAAGYEPGVPTAELLEGVLESGQLVVVEATVEPGAQLAQLMAGDDELAWLLPLLAGNALRLALGGDADAARLELSALNAQGDTSLSALVDLTGAGVALESNLIPGQRLTASWDALLADVLRGSGGLEAGLPIQLGEYLPASGSEAELDEYLAPYVAIAQEYLTGAVTEVKHDVPEEEGFPAVESELYIEMTYAELGELLSRLLDELEQDEALLELQDALLVQRGAPGSATDMCRALRLQASAYFAQDGLYSLILGLNDEEFEQPWFAILGDSMPSGVFNTVVIDARPDEHGALDLELIFSQTLADGSDGDYLYLCLGDHPDAADAEVGERSLEVVLVQGDEQSALVYTDTSEAYDEDGLPGYLKSLELQVVLPDGKIGYAYIELLCEQVDAEHERLILGGTASFGFEDDLTTIDASGALELAPEGDALTGDGFMTLYACDDADNSVELATLNLELSSAEPAPGDAEALEVELRSLSEEELTELLELISAQLQTALLGLMA